MKQPKTKKLDMSLAMRIASEHLSYRSLIAEIEDDLERVRRAETDSTESLVGLLRSFYAQVRAHFALEERGGLFEVYQERELELRRQAAVMLAQHADFLARLRAILDVVSGLEKPDGPELEQCARDLRELFGALRAHELAEDDLLDRLVEQDIRRGG
jgi:hypothetical protein